MMKRREFFTGASAIVVASRVAYSRPATAVDKPIALGGRRELFVVPSLTNELWKNVEPMNPVPELGKLEGRPHARFRPVWGGAACRD